MKGTIFLFACFLLSRLVVDAQIPTWMIQAEMEDFMILRGIPLQDNQREPDILVTRKGGPNGAKAEVLMGYTEGEFSVRELIYASPRLQALGARLEVGAEERKVGAYYKWFKSDELGLIEIRHTKREVIAVFFAMNVVERRDLVYWATIERDDLPRVLAYLRSLDRKRDSPQVPDRSDTEETSD